MTQNANDHQYWAFVSYTEVDRRIAQAWARKLERYPIPWRSAHLASKKVPKRLHPVYLDQQEYRAAASLGNSIEKALDESRWLVLIASPASAKSDWVRKEVAYFIEQGRQEEIIVVSVVGKPYSGGSTESLPPALIKSDDRVLWIDSPADTRVTSKNVARVVATILDLNFDALWRRRLRARRNAVLVAVVALIVVLFGVQRWLDWQGDEQRSNVVVQQTRQFQSFYQRQLTSMEGAAEVPFSILMSNDVNDDGRLDFLALVVDPGYCGSGGCSSELFLARADGTYASVLQTLGTQPRMLPSTSQGFHDIAIIGGSVGRQAHVYDIHKWNGNLYELGEYRVCAVEIEFCDQPNSSSVEGLPVTVPRAPAHPDLELVTLADKNAGRSAPSDLAVPVPSPDASGSIMVLGAVAGSEWYLVDLWKNEMAFVRETDLVREQVPDQ